MTLLLWGGLAIRRLLLLNGLWTFTLLLRVRKSMSTSPPSSLILLRLFEGGLQIFWGFRLGLFPFSIWEYLLLLLGNRSLLGKKLLISCAVKSIIGLIIGFLLLQEWLFWNLLSKLSLFIGILFRLLLCTSWGNLMLSHNNFSRVVTCSRLSGVLSSGKRCVGKRERGTWGCVLLFWMGKLWQPSYIGVGVLVNISFGPVFSPSSILRMLTLLMFPISL